MIRKKSLEEMNLLDKFLFDEAIEDPEFFEILLTIILGRDIVLEDPPQVEKEFRISVQKRKVQIDVWGKDLEGTIYDVEPQQRNLRNLPRRSRLYHALITSNLLPPGSIDYNLLSDVIMIIIAPFDPFGKDQYMYTFRMTCEEFPEMLLDDGMTTIFLNTRGTDANGISTELIDLLHYFENTTDEIASRSGSRRIHTLQRKVQQIRHNEQIGVKLMNTWEEHIMIREDGISEGHAKGLSEGHAKGLSEGHAKGLVDGHRDAIRNLMKNMGLTASQAMDAIGIPQSEQHLYADLSDETENRPLSCY